MPRPPRCCGNTNEELVNNLHAVQLITTDRVKQAMLAVDRANYSQHNPYQDGPQKITSHATISAPHMHALALEFLASALKPGAKVLDVGCGSGYLTACFARIVGDEGRVYGIDYLEELVNLSRENIMKADSDLLVNGKVSLLVGDGWKGLSAEGPFDAIHVGAGAEELPTALFDQLREGGVLVVPVGPQGDFQKMLQIFKVDGHPVITEHMSVKYVPLVRNEIKETGAAAEVGPVAPGM